LVSRSGAAPFLGCSHGRVAHAGMGFRHLATASEVDCSRASPSGGF
jgi:hypothetical protein